MFNRELIQNFIDDHKSKYKGKYRFHSCYQSGEHSFKIRYYMFDDTFKEIDIYIDLSITDEITYHFSANLFDQEQNFIIVQFLKRLLIIDQYPSYLHYKIYEQAVKAIQSQQIVLEPYDYIKLLNYMKYQEGYNYETMDKFYELYIPCMELLIENGHFNKAIESMSMLLDTIVWEYKWPGYDIRYMDTEYQYHVYHFKKLLELVYSNVDKLETVDRGLIYKCLNKIFNNPRFAFLIMTQFEKLVMAKTELATSLIEKLRKDYVLVDKEVDGGDAGNSAFSIIYYVYHGDAQGYYETLLHILRNVVRSCLTYANDDVNIAIGASIISQQGYDILMDLFSRDFNTYLFDVFPIPEWPIEYHGRIKEELIQAFRFYSGRMDAEEYKYSSFEQCKNITRLLIDYFGDVLK